MSAEDIALETKHFKPEDAWHGIIRQESIFAPEADRYQLIIGLFCPFAHRANLVRHLKKLTNIIDVSVVKPYPKGNEKGYPGWRFLYGGDEYPNATRDTLFGSEYLHELYFKVDPNYSGRYSVPVLWDKKLNTIVNNESAELLRWLPSAFDVVKAHPQTSLDLYPAASQRQIDAITEWMQRDLNTGVYKAGFATDEGAYAKNVPSVFAALNKVEKTIVQNGGPFILGKQLTELDLRCKQFALNHLPAFPTMLNQCLTSNPNTYIQKLRVSGYATVIRFDPVYVQHFKCNLGMIRSHYPVTNNWLKNLYYNVPGFRETTDFKHIKENYTKSHYDINPFAITPVGPQPDIEQGVMDDLSQIRPGSVDLPSVLELEVKL